MDNGIHELNVIIGKSREVTEHFFGRPDFIVDSFTAYWRDNTLLLLLSGEDQVNSKTGKVINGYLLFLPDGEIIASDSVHLLNDDEVMRVKNLKTTEDIINGEIPVHGDVGSGLSIPVFLTDRGTAIVLQILGKDVIDCQEENVRELFSKKSNDDSFVD